MNNVNCTTCNKEFNVYPSRFASRKNFFCCKKCEAIYTSETRSQKIKCNCIICKKEIKIKLSQFNRRNRNQEITCSTKCMGIHRQNKYTGRNNPNCRYNLDDNFFNKIDCQKKAYILGFIASDGTVAKNNAITISIKKIDIDILEKMRDFILKDLPIAYGSASKKDFVTLRLCSKQMSKDICKWLKIHPGKKDFIVQLPNLDKEMQWHFLRGYFDGDGSVGIKKRRYKDKMHLYLTSNIASTSIEIKQQIKELVGFGGVYAMAIYWSHSQSMNFLSRLYKNSSIQMNRKYNRYQECLKITDKRLKESII